MVAVSSVYPIWLVVFGVSIPKRDPAKCLWTPMPVWTDFVSPPRVSQLTTCIRYKVAYELYVRIIHFHWESTNTYIPCF